MTKADFRMATRRAVLESGKDFDLAVFEKAYGRAKRWMVAAYGSVDLDNYAGESCLDLSCYYYDVLNATANKSFNRMVFTGGR